MNKLIEEYFVKINGTVSSRDQCIQQVRQVLQSAYDEVPSEPSFKEMKLMLLDYEHIWKAIDTYKDGKASINTKLSYTNSMIHLCRIFKVQGTEQFFKGKVSGLKSDRELVKHGEGIPEKISREQVNEYIKYYKNLLSGSSPSKATALKDYLRVKIITTYPFRLETGTLESISSADHAELKESGNLGIRNFLITEGQNYIFEFNGYKTAKLYKTRSIPIEEPEIIELMSKYLPTIGENDFLFHKGSRTNEYSADMTEAKIQAKQRNNLTSWVKKSLKKSINYDGSITDITKLLISEIWENKNSTGKDVEQFAMWRGHDVSTAAKMYAASQGSKTAIPTSLV